MSELKIIPLKVEEAYFDSSNRCISVIGTFDDRQIQTEISQDCFSFGNRSEKDIIREMEKTAKMFVGKTINVKCCDEDFK